MKIGDNIICVKSCIMDLSNRKSTTINKLYKVKRITEDLFYIIDDNNDQHSFLLKNFNKKDGYFRDIKYNRKIKLQKLNEKN